MSGDMSGGGVTYGYDPERKIYFIAYGQAVMDFDNYGDAKDFNDKFLLKGVPMWSVQ